MKQKIRVMVVDDSVLFRNWLIQGLGNDSRFEVVGYAINAMDAKNKLPTLTPDIMTLDIEMPGMSGLDFLREVLPVHPIPIILVSSLDVRVFDALAAGAVDFVRKPNDQDGGREAFLATLKAKLSIGANAKVRLPSRTVTVASITGQATKPLPATSVKGGAGTYNAAPPAPALGRAMSGQASGPAAPVRSASLVSPYPNIDIVAIGASTGGTEAILEVVRQFPARMPGIVITQHMPPGFTAMYAERLNRICRLEVREACHGDKVQPGLILLAPGGLQMRIVRLGSGYAVSCTDEEKVSGHRPSVDVLFSSVAMHAKNRAIGVILTGMGADGAAGLLRMRKAGAYTIGQDRDTCVVYGMPMEAYKIGAVCQQSPLGSVAQAVMNQLAKG